MTPQNLPHSLELKVPPAAVLLILAALMWLAARAVPSLRIVVPGRILFAASLAVAGVVVVVLGVRAFRRARTTINPMKPSAASALVTGGVYAVTRNPMYLGCVVVLSGWALFLANTLAFVLLPVFILYMNALQIGPEERALTARFGEEFIAYQSRVRRWL